MVDGRGARERGGSRCSSCVSDMIGFGVVCASVPMSINVESRLFYSAGRVWPSLGLTIMNLVVCDVM